MDLRDETHVLVVPIADRFPAFLQPIVGLWDAEQAWLIPHHVCMRHQEHKVFLLDQEAHLPPRSEGGAILFKPDHPVMGAGSVGVVGWVLPNVAVIDTLGLNDVVVAHKGGIKFENFRKMAHDRVPPRGYVECFRPNVQRVGRHMQVVPRILTDAEIVACEARWAP
jgi:arabinofuranosyltransferase